MRLPRPAGMLADLASHLPSLRRPLAAGAFVLAFAGTSAADPPTGGPELLKLGFTYAMFTGINENDARASIKSLATTIARERNIPADLDPHLYDGTVPAAAAMQSGDVNALGLTVEEFWLLRDQISAGSCLVAVHGDDATERYVVLTHRASGLATLDHLRHRRLGVTTGPRVCLAGIWFELELAKKQLPSATDFLDRTILFSKPAKAVLAVFFGQIDACLVTRRVFDTMVELNPQVAKELKIIAVSPPFVPALFVISDRFSPDFLSRVVHEFTFLHRSTAGQQVLTIFQTDRVAFRPASELQPALDLLDEYARVFPDAPRPRIAASIPARLAAAPP